MSDLVRRLSDELARDPASLVFVQLGEALRRQGAADLALKVALRGLERHPYHADGHDLLARVAVDRGELQRALDEWDMTLKLAPQHVGARKGLGFVCFREGRLEDAEHHLAAAAELDPDDRSIAAALDRVREMRRGGGAAAPARGAASPGEAEPWTSRSVAADRVPALAEEDPRLLFADLLGSVEGTALLLDAGGLVLAGAYVVEGGDDVAQEVGAALSGVSDEVVRATRHLDIGDWSSMTFEAEYATVSMAPVGGEGLVLLATSRATPLGLARRMLERCVTRAARFLGWPS